MTDQKYGVNTVEIEKIIQTVEGLTLQEYKGLTLRLRILGQSLHNNREAYDAAYNAALFTGHQYGYVAESERAFDDVEHATMRVSHYEPLDSESYVSVILTHIILAHIVQPHIGEVFTQEHFDLLTKPWNDFLGLLDHLRLQEIISRANSNQPNRLSRFMKKLK